MGADETHPKVPRSWLMPTEGYFLSALKSYSNQGMSLMTPSSRRARRMIWGITGFQLILSPQDIMEQIPIEAISRHTKGKKVIGNSQHKLTRRKLCQINLATLLWGWRESWGCHLVWLYEASWQSPTISFSQIWGIREDVEEQLAGLPGSMVVQNVTNSQL